jgi:hypothetical protein
VTVTVDAAAVAGLMANPAAVAEFPFLKPATAASAPRGCCGSPTPGESAARRAISAIAALPESRLAVLKRLLGADTVVVYVTEHGRPRRVAR